MTYMDTQGHENEQECTRTHTGTHIRSQSVYMVSRWISTRITSPYGRELKLLYVYEPQDQTYSWLRSQKAFNLDIQQHTGRLKDTQGHTRTYKDTQGHTRTQGHARTHKNEQERTRMHKNTQECTRTHTGTHIRSQAVYMVSRWISTRITSPDGRELKLQYVYEPQDQTYSWLRSQKAFNLDIQQHTGRLKDTQGHTRTRKDTRGHTRTHKDTQGHTRTHKDTQGHTRTHKDTQGHTRTHKNA
jgi:hypothetical protein